MNKSIKIIFIMFSILFCVILSSLIYFLTFKSEYYANHELNKRRNEFKTGFIRGDILDRDGEVLVFSEREGHTKKRIYKYGEYFLHPIGYFSERYGSSGIENYLNSFLKEPNGVFSKIKSFFKKNGEIYGESVKLTLNKEIQKYAYEIMGNNKGSIVVMNPKTGEIYAMVSTPSFNPNLIESSWEEILKMDGAPFYNRALNGNYPPGSVFKVLTAGAAIENIYDVLNRRFMDNGFISFNEIEKLFNQNEKAFGEIDLSRAFINSSNVVFGELSIELRENLKNYAERFYFNRELNIYGLNISKSYFPSYDLIEKGLIAQSGIGQGDVLATPIVMAMIASAVANDGVLNEPYIISEILNNDGWILRKFKPKTLGRAMRLSTSKVLKDYMRGVVIENLSHISDFSNIKAAGKTGTADHKKDGKDGIPHSLFIGFAPYDDPKISISVIIEEGGEGRKLASEISAKVMNKAIEIIK